MPSARVAVFRQCFRRGHAPWGDGPGRRRENQPMPAPRTSPSKLLRSGSHNARNRSSVESRAGPAARILAQARMPPTARSAPRGERRGLLVLTAGPVPYLRVGVTQPARWSRPYLIDRAGFQPLSLPRGPNRGREGLRTMTPMRQDLAAPAWLAPQDLSAAGQDANDPQVAVDGQGNAIAVWSRSNGTNDIVQAAVRAAGPQTAALAWSPAVSAHRAGSTPPSCRRRDCLRPCRRRGGDVLL